MKRNLRTISKLRERRKKCSLSSTFKLQLYKGFKVSRKPFLNLCSFRWLKRRRDVVKYLTLSGSLPLNIDLFLGHIKERSLLLKTAIDSEFCDHSDRTESGKKDHLKESVLQLKKGLCFLRVS